MFPNGAAPAGQGAPSNKLALKQKITYSTQSQALLIIPIPTLAVLCIVAGLL